MSRREAEIPEGAVTSTVTIRVPFFDTDAMGIVHHSNYVRYLEIARVHLLDEHQRPYSEWVARGLHFAVTRVEVDYVVSARFDDRVDVHTWVSWVRGASLGIGYALLCEGKTVASGLTEHALVDDDGRPRRMPKDLREEMTALVPPGSPGRGNR